MNNLTVAFNGVEVGTLERDNRGAMAFHYKTQWLNTSSARAISLSLPLGEKIYTGANVFNFFQNLLPDSDTIINRIQTRFQIASKHPFDLLASVGRDCIGAIQLYPEDCDIPPVDQIYAEPLNENAIIQLLEGYQTTPLGMDGQNDFRISLAGAQEKTALLWHKNTWQRPHGSTPTSHIFKLPIGKITHNPIDLSESCENEWLCLKLAQAFGLPAANAEIATFGHKTVLVVERFDRQWSSDKRWLMRLPQEDMCQALGIAPALKYESDGGVGIKEIMQLLIGSQQPNRDRELFFRSQVLYWLLAAIDGHAKNFSIFIQANSSYCLTPLYDILSAYPIFGSQGISPKKAKMAMALHGKNRHYHWEKIQARHFISTAELVGLPSLLTEEIMAEMASNAESIVNQVSKQLPEDFPNFISDAIFNGILKQARKIL